MERAVTALSTHSFKERLCPEPARTLPAERGMRVILRTGHIMAAGILLGGHFFDVESKRLLPWLWLVIATGAMFVALELYGSGVWLVQGRGLMTLFKLVLLAMTPFFWEQRFWLLLAVLCVGSIGSHMSSRFRHYSLLHGRALAHKPRG